MRASLRWKDFILGGLLLVPGAAVAQSTSDPAPASPPAADSVGPQELQNFTLSGSVTKPAEQQPATSPAAAPPAPRPALDRNRHPAAVERVSIGEGDVARRADATKAAPVPPRASVQRPAATVSISRPSLQRTPPLASVPPATAVTSPLQPTAFPAAPTAPTAAPLDPEHKLLLWPWIVAALALAGGALILLRRRRSESAFAGVPQADQFVAPEPLSAPPVTPPVLPRGASPRASPQPAAAPPIPKKPVSSGIVSTRLRPVLEIDTRPLRCLVEDGRVVLEFELELFNSGTAPARAVLAEASLFNAGPAQEQELAAFFANPVGAGERLDVIPPMKRITFSNQVVAPREAIQEYELGGRKVFVPILAFNALYAWSAGEAQTSTAYLVGRDTMGEKLGPLSLDRAPRQIATLAARALPSAVRS